MNLVYGHGFNDRSISSVSFGKSTKEYSNWKRMLERCYSKAMQEKCPTYKKCFVDDKFKSFSYFYEWWQKQIGFGLKGWELDKDLLIKGNNIYSEESCVFLPQEINKILTNRKASRGKYPIGVNFELKSNKLRSQISINGKRKFLGYFDSEIHAFNAYKLAKEMHMKDIAEKYKGIIDNKAYNALMSYEVNIND